MTSNPKLLPKYIAPPFPFDDANALATNRDPTRPAQTVHQYGAALGGTEVGHPPERVVKPDPVRQMQIGSRYCWDGKQTI